MPSEIDRHLYLPVSVFLCKNAKIGDKWWVEAFRGWRKITQWPEVNNAALAAGNCPWFFGIGLRPFAQQGKFGDFECPT